MHKFVNAGILLALATTAAHAADTPVTDWAMEVVDVEAKAPGPAMWQLKKGDSVVWVLGTVGLMPEKLAWSTVQLDRAVAGANAVLLPPKAEVGFFGFFDMSWFLLTHRGALSMPGDEKLEDSLSPELRRRFVAARQELHEKADRYEDDSPLLAGFKLLGDFTKAEKLTIDLPERTAEKIARVHHVAVRHVAEYSANPVIKEMLKLPPEAGRVCFKDAVDDYETLSRHTLAAADAWAMGDVAGIKANYSISLFSGCVSQAKSYNNLDQRAVGDVVKAVNEALAKPGKTVLVIDIGWLFRAGGAAEQLKAEGVTIEGPGG